MQRKGLQDWIEHQAEVPAFVIAALCMIARAASAYSGGAFSLPHLLGPVGTLVFDGATGIGLAVGAELLASIAGRAARRHENEAAEAALLPGIKRTERDVRITQETRAATLNRRYSWLGLGASVFGAMSFLWTANPHHDWLTIAGEIAVTTILVSIVYYLGVVKEQVREDPREIATGRAVEMQLDMLDAAGKRIAAGDATARDVRLVAEHLPRAQRPRFRAVMGEDRADDPIWKTPQIAAWLCSTGASDVSVRKRITRRLREAEDRGENIGRDDRGAYQLPRSVAMQLFTADYFELAGVPDLAGTLARHRAARDPVLVLPYARADGTRTAHGQPTDPAMVAAVTAGGVQ